MTPKLERDRSRQTQVVEPFNPLREILFKPEKIRVDLLESNSPCVTGAIFQIVQGAFRRYTYCSDGKDRDGNPVPWERDVFDKSPGKVTYLAAIQDNVVLGTVRVARGWQEPVQPAAIDAMILMTGHDWPDPLQVRFGEVGHFALHPQVARKDGLIVQRQLYERVMQLAQEEGFRERIFVVLGHTRRFVEDSRIRLTLYDEADLNWGNPQAVRVFGDYPRYWQPEIFSEYNRNGRPAEPPKLYRYGV